jgi:hypothetical protein
VISASSLAGASVSPPAYNPLGAYLAGSLGPISVQPKITIAASQYAMVTAVAELAAPEDSDASLQLRMCYSSTDAAGSWSVFPSPDESAVSGGQGSVFPNYGNYQSYSFTRSGVLNLTGTYYVALCAAQSGGGSGSTATWSSQQTDLFGEQFTGQSKVVTMILQ